MDVAPHPHIGLQTITWLLAGEVLHDDSLRHEVVLRPGGLNVMTSGGGIAHAERTPIDNTGRLDGVQLWTALPDAHRHVPASFQHISHVPALEISGGLIYVFSGQLENVSSPAPHYSELLGADIQVHPSSTLTIPLWPAFEYAVLTLSGDCSLNGQRLDDRVLYYLGTKRSEAALSSSAGARVLLVGGPPFPETILMWWNFVARTPEEIRSARTDWEEHQRFGEVIAYNGPRLTAPDLVRFARPNPLS
jgi:redox-sensitive bicupin YhaK (pirin superfamily)